MDEDADGNIDTRSTYRYDDSGIRVAWREQVDSDDDGAFDEDTTTVNLVDHRNPTGYQQVLEETQLDTATEAVQQRRIFTLGLDVISQQDAETAYGSPLFFLYDGHGSTRALTYLGDYIMEGGLLVAGQLFRYDAYGNSIDFDPTAAYTNLLYSGEHLDTATNQQYLRARYYDLATGRFNRLDPFAGNLEDPASLHKYLYTHGDPVNGVDPTGLMTLGSLGTAIASGAKLTAFCGVAGAGVFKFVLGRSATEGFIVGSEVGLGWFLARNKLEALGMGALSMVFECFVEWLDPNGYRGKELVAESLVAFAEGIFDSGFDQWASGLTVMQTHGTIVGNGQVSVAPFVGFFHPFIVLTRAAVMKAVKGEGPLDSRQLVAATIEASLAMLTNESGLALTVRLPASVRKRVAAAATKLVLIPPGKTFKSVAEEIAADIAAFWDPAMRRFWEFMARGAEEIPEE
ncbi:MAG: RHS repeat-associated core domain-containing protein [Patescibacteria group bacterium]|nr:RHS repeat-associated core domain-containing protein [Patescibacteria group bacterium]